MRAILMTAALPAILAAQQYEVGGLGGAGFFKNAAVTSAAGAASAGFKSGAAFGGLIGNNMYPHLSGELRYLGRMSDLRVASRSSEATFKGWAHAIHYDLLFHARKQGSPIRPYVAGGAGAKIFMGSGKETAFQPLSGFALLTKTREIKPMVSAGAGVKIRLTPRMNLRTEFRDYITPFPKQVIAPAPGAKIGNWLHDFVPMIGISYEF